MEMLKRLRVGKCSPEDLKVLKGCQETQFPEGIVPTKLYSKNSEVDRINLQELARLGKPLATYRLEITGSHDMTLKYAKSANIPDVFEVCEGAQVMLSRNINVEGGLANGSRGVVTEVTLDGVVVKFLNGREELVKYYEVKLENEPAIKFRYLPLKLAWATSIHKSQGMTLDAIQIDIGASIFAYGQAYTALSRARRLDSVKIIHVEASSFKTSPEVLDFFSTHSKA
jgi:ATP-dependent DNA helicase PIF1